MTLLNSLITQYHVYCRGRVQRVQSTRSRLSVSTLHQGVQYTVRKNTEYILPVFFLVHIQKVDGVSIDVSPEQLVRLWLIEWTLAYFSLGII